MGLYWKNYIHLFIIIMKGIQFFILTSVHLPDGNIFSFVHPKYCCNAIMGPLYYTKQPFVVQKPCIAFLHLQMTKLKVCYFLFTKFTSETDKRVDSSMRVYFLWRVFNVKFWGRFCLRNIKMSVTSLSYLCPFLFFCCSRFHIYKTGFAILQHFC